MTHSPLDTRAPQHQHWTRLFQSMQLVGITETSSSLRVSLENNRQLTACPKCQKGPLLGYGRSQLRIWDLPINNKSVILEIALQRYRCKACLATFNEPIQNTCPKHRATTRLANYIVKHAFEQPFAKMAEYLKLDEKTLRNIFNDYVDDLKKGLNSKHYPNNPFPLSIAPVTITRKTYLFWLNAQENTLIDITALSAQPIALPTLLATAAITEVFVADAITQPLGDWATGLKIHSQVLNAHTSAPLINAINQWLLRHYAKRSFNVFYAAAVLDKSLHRVERVLSAAGNKPLHYKKMNYGTHLEALLQRLLALNNHRPTGALSKNL